jgi:hypothetical protein
MTQIIEIALTEPPEQGRSMGNVFSTAGEKFKAWPDKIAQLKIGGSYAVEVTDHEFNGHSYRKITKVKAANGGAAKITNGESSGTSTAPHRPASGEAEWQFVRELLVVGVRTGAVAFSAHDLNTAIAMLRALWRDVA